jgi:hypothetical protein
MKRFLLKITVITAFIIPMQYAIACPELNNVDLADGEGPWVYEVVENNGIFLTKEEFIKIPYLDIEDYERCKNSLYLKKVSSKLTGRFFNAVMTNQDKCDGGNSYGALFDSSMNNMIGDIGDSYISCY